jgi:hypothetical protein
MSTWRHFEVALLKANGWEPNSVPGKFEDIRRKLSTRAHDVRVVQGQDRMRVVISTKVLSGVWVMKPRLKCAPRIEEY